MNIPKSKKTNYDTTIIFRWDSCKENFLKKLAFSKRLSVSDFIRLVLDSFITSRGFRSIDSSSSSN